MKKPAREPITIALNEPRTPGDLNYNDATGTLIVCLRALNKLTNSGGKTQVLTTLAAFYGIKFS